MKHYFFVLLLFLTGCVAQPEYYSHSQAISLEGLSTNTEVLYQNERLISEKGKLDIDPVDQPDEKNVEFTSYTIDRSWNNQELIIKKEGFKDYHLKLESALTSEPWATAESPTGGKHKFPLIGMLFPGKTLTQVASTVTSLAGFVFSVIKISTIDAAENIVDTGVALIGLPKALALDIYDIISIPGTTIVNPWVKYQYNSVVVLEPTEQLKKSCALQAGSFISNDGCLQCTNSSLILYASQEECAKCANRQWQDGACQLKQD